VRLTWEGGRCLSFSGRDWGGLLVRVWAGWGMGTGEVPSTRVGRRQESAGGDTLVARQPLTFRMAVLVSFFSGYSVQKAFLGGCVPCAIGF
jgi:hypothetical protein